MKGIEYQSALQTVISQAKLYYPLYCFVSYSPGSWSCFNSSVAVNKSYLNILEKVDH